MPLKYPCRGTATIQIDFCITPLLAYFGGLGQTLWLTAAQLQGDGLLTSIEIQQPVLITMLYGCRANHFGI